MGMRINTNISSLAAQRALGVTKNNLDNNFRKLSTGERITRAADDAAGLAISEKLKAHIRLLESAEREKEVSNGMVLDRISELLSWEIEKKHNLDDFRKAMRDTIFFVELGIKRKLVDFDKRTQSKLYWSKYYLQNEVEARSFFFNKKRRLEQESKNITIQTLSLQTVVPTLSVQTAIGA